MMAKCPKCGRKKEMYYRSYCPVDDKMDIAKLGRHGAWNLIPMKNYCKDFVSGFNEEDFWFRFVDMYSFKGNDSFWEYCVDYRTEDDDGDPILDEFEPFDKMYVMMCKEYGIDPFKPTLFWISW